MQAQDYPGATWAVGQRVGTARGADVDAAYDAGAFVRTHVMRPTWHLVAAEDLRWLQALTAPRVHQASAYHYGLLGIDAAEAARAVDVFVRALEGGRALTREALGVALGQAGIEATGNRLAYLVSWAELEAIVCSGPREGRRHTYALVDERVPAAPPRSREEALAELARRYVAGHGPAQAVDLAWWSGLTKRDAVRALESASPPLARETIDGRTFWSAPMPAPASTREAPAAGPGPSMRLLPNYDELLVGFADRGDAMDPALPPPARAAQEILAHVIVRDGLVVGGWKRRESRAAVVVEPHLAVALDATERAALGGQLERLGAFLGRSVAAPGLD